MNILKVIVIPKDIFEYNVKDGEICVVLGEEEDCVTYELKDGKLYITNSDDDVYIYVKSSIDFDDLDLCSELSVLKSNSAKTFGTKK